MRSGLKKLSKCMAVLLTAVLIAAAFPIAALPQFETEVYAAAYVPDKDYFYIESRCAWFSIHCSVADSGLMFCTSYDSTWKEFKSIGNTPETINGRIALSPGERAYFKASTKIDTLNPDPGATPVNFKLAGVTDSGAIAVGGNIMSLLDPDFTASSQLDPVKSAYAFAHLFEKQLFSGPEGSKWSTNGVVVDASNLRLPSNTAPHCYEGMFMGNYDWNSGVGITKGPDLPATTLTAGCYKNMFGSCRNLSGLKVSFTDWGDGTNTEGWLGDVASSGFLECSDELAKAAEGLSSFGSIPFGWQAGVKYIAPDYYLAIDSQNIQLKAYSSAELPKSMKVYDSNGTEVSNSYISGLTFTYPKDSKIKNGRTVYGDLYRITFTVGGETYNIRANIQTVVEKTAKDFSMIDEPLAKISYLSAQVDELAAYDMCVFLDADLSGIETIPLLPKGMVPGMYLFGKNAYDTAIALASQVNTYKFGNKTQAEIETYAAQLKTAADDLYKNFDMNGFMLSGNTLEIDSYTPVSYAKGLYRDEAECVTTTSVESTGSLNLTDGVYTFFAKTVLAFDTTVDFSKYIIVGSDPVAVLKDQFGTKYNSINSMNDALAIIDKIFEEVDEEKHKEDQPAPSGGGGGGTHSDPEPVEEFILTAGNDGTFSWTVADGVKLIGVAYSMNVSLGNEVGAEYYPLSIIGTNKVMAMDNGDHAFRVTMQVGGKTVVKYYHATAVGCNGPAVVSMSSAVGIFPRRSDLEIVGYALGNYSTLTQIVNSNNAVYTIAKAEGIILDKSLFSTGDYTFFFKYTDGSTDVLPMSIQ